MMGCDAVGMYIGITKNGLHRVLFDADITDKCNLRDMLGNLEVVLQLQTICQRITDSDFRPEEPEVVLRITLPVVTTTGAKTPHIVELPEMSFQLREQIERRGMHIVDGLGIALIHVVAVPLTVLYSSGKRERLQPVFMDSLAP